MDIFFTTISTSILLGALAFLFKNAILTRLTNAVKHEYNEKLEALKSKLKAENDHLVSELKHLSDSKLQRSAEARKLKQEYYHSFLEAVSMKLSNLSDMKEEEGVLANQKFCIEVNRLPLYASQEVVEFVNKFAGGGNPPNFTDLYTLIRRDLCSDTYDSFNTLSQVHFQIPNKSQANKANPADAPKARAAD